ncbi:tol-pal system protein YbgF [Geopsychrobacter electrodiphilus]|uniref:tol-pal system protein YbgF n=1 Tax=Geopsychrobacter electrodiphilus TaxID=225196 RepID=UPI00037F6631|nr:tol-pal system protein YbgF [Geopsychrobacter electrodiphilus]
MKRLLGLGCLLLVLAGCLPAPQAQLKMENDFEEMKRHLAHLEQGNSDGGSQAKRQVETLGRQVAELQSGLDSLRVEVQSINGRLDEVNRSNQQSSADLSLVRDDLSMQISVLTKRLNDMEAKALQAPPVAEAATPPGKAEENTSPEMVYQAALEKILNGSDFEGGRKALEAFIQKYPKHELQVNALYWIGEALYGEKKYEAAILKFQEVIQQHSDHPKAAAALLKQGKAFMALGDKQNAKTTWKTLVKTFPLSPEAEKAKLLLK